MEPIVIKQKFKYHIVTIDNHSDFRKNKVSILNIAKGHEDLRYSYSDNEGNNNYFVFIDNLNSKKEKINKIRMHVNCEYRKFREKQIHQWLTIKDTISSVACPLRLDPYQFQSDCVESSIENVDHKFMLNDDKIDLVLEYLMPDTTIQFTIISEQI